MAKTKLSIKKLPFRESVICYISVKNKILICHKPSRDIDDWGLIGGGIESDETIEEAASRELEEEVGLKKASVIINRIIKNRHSYTWDEAMAAQTGFIGQTQHLVFASINEKCDLRLQVGGELDGLLWVDLQEAKKFISKTDLYKVIEEASSGRIS